MKTESRLFHIARRWENEATDSIWINDQYIGGQYVNVYLRMSMKKTITGILGQVLYTSPIPVVVSACRCSSTPQMSLL